MEPGSYVIEYWVTGDCLVIDRHLRLPDAPSEKKILVAEMKGLGTFWTRGARESLWLNQKQMALLFDKDSDTISWHLSNVFKEGESNESATTEEFSVVQKEGSGRYAEP